MLFRQKHITLIAGALILGVSLCGRSALAGGACETMTQSDGPDAGRSVLMCPGADGVWRPVGSAGPAAAPAPIGRTVYDNLDDALATVLVARGRPERYLPNSKQHLRIINQRADGTISLWGQYSASYDQGAPRQGQFFARVQGVQVLCIDVGAFNPQIPALKAGGDTRDCEAPLTMAAAEAKHAQALAAAKLANEKEEKEAREKQEAFSRKIDGYRSVKYNPQCIKIDNKVTYKESYPYVCKSGKSVCREDDVVQIYKREKFENYEYNNICDYPVRVNIICDQSGITRSISDFFLGSAGIRENEVYDQNENLLVVIKKGQFDMPRTCKIKN
ncbi:MAG: hypothetical protein P4N41_22560 [Negativicutes bacterium]|nr:hypothetical protein [Negativicutes bacterium]